MTRSSRSATALTITLLTACSSAPVSLTESDLALGEAVGIPESRLLEVKRAGASLRQLEGIDEGGMSYPAFGVTIDVRESEAVPTVHRLRGSLGPGYLVFVSERHFGIGGRLDQLSVLRGNDPFDMLRTMGTNGWNHDLGPDAVIARLERWNADFGIDLHGVGFDWLEGTFREKPDDMAAFAREVYEFCPDVVDQGTETVEALAGEMRRSNTLYLWWD